MRAEKFTPGQRVTGAGAEIESGETFKPKDSTDTATAQLTGAARYRHLKREAAIMALGNLDPQDAAVICATVLDEIAAGDPPFDPWGDLRADAEFWADCANPPELEVYFASALKRLNNQSLGLRARKRMIVALFLSLSAADRAGFLEWGAAQ